MLSRIEDVDQVIANLFPIGRRRLRRADVESAVDLEGVGVDDLAVDLACQSVRECALAGGGRSDDGDDRRWHAAAV
ncbi:MAG: hypothetical protein R2862_13050 [Thermoanaerobaculia bacterium]